MKKLALGLMMMVSVVSFGRMNDVEREARLMAMSYKSIDHEEGVTSEVAMGNDVTVTFLEFKNRRDSKAYFNSIEEDTTAYLEANPEETIGVKFESSSRELYSRSIEDGRGIEVIRRGRDVAVIEVHRQNDQEIRRAKELVGNVL